MPFFLFLVFGVWFLLILVNDKSRQMGRWNNFPLMKHQEEYVLFYELYMQYQKEPDRTDPEGDALEDARQKIWDDGYLPTPFQHYGRNDWRHRPLTRRSRFRFPAGKTPRYSELLYYRKEDCRPGGIQTDFLRLYGKDIAIDEKAWGEYCLEIDRRFAKLIEDYNIEKYITQQNRPLASALEYLLACCQMAAPRDTSVRVPKGISWDSVVGRPWTLWAVKTEILQRGFIPTSLKPRSTNPNYDMSDMYTPEWKPQKERVEQLLAIDEKYWAEHNIPGFEDYREQVVSFYQQLQTHDKVVEGTYEQYLGYNERGSVFVRDNWHRLDIIENPLSHLGRVNSLNWSAADWLSPRYQYGDLEVPEEILKDL